MLRVGITYPRILLGLILTDFLLTFIVPSGIARVVIMASIALGLAEAFKSGVGSNVSRGMFLILSYTANIFDKMIIAGAGAITARGLIEKVSGVEVLWSYWFIAFLPCSIITVLAAWWLTLWLYPPETVALEGGYDYLRAEIEKMGSWSALEKKAALLIHQHSVTDRAQTSPCPVQPTPGLALIGCNPNFINVDLTVGHSFGKWQVAWVGFYSSDLNEPVLGYQKQSQFAMGGLLGYDFGAVILQGYLTSDVYEKNYGGKDVRGWARIILPLNVAGAPLGPPPPPITRKQ
jgi:Sodium:sulfate symporter transmembrane region/Putative MetA-pathway of phenol degradation